MDKILENDGFVNIIIYFYNQHIDYYEVSVGENPDLIKELESYEDDIKKIVAIVSKTKIKDVSIIFQFIHSMINLPEELLDFFIDLTAEDTNLNIDKVYWVLFNFIQIQRFSQAERIIEKGFKVDWTPSKETPRLFAVVCDFLFYNDLRLDIFCKKLLDFGANPNIMGDEKESPIIICFRYGKFDIAKKIFLNPLFDRKTKHNDISFFELCKNEDLKLFMISKGFRPRVSEDFMKDFVKTKEFDILLFKNIHGVFDEDALSKTKEAVMSTTYK